MLIWAGEAPAACAALMMKTTELVIEIKMTIKPAMMAAGVDSLIQVGMIMAGKGSSLTLRQ